ncbi:LLM class flavin-dependent oxidoreductase [Herbidospora mongoliensis]|uniref:LLM class flavin-dependent oxidoreductase n=1 Tax=Herbidospora mongoliensis TaxID=688067 RepID=UPI00082E2DAD|nr:LLM class flavin-dependent oxidoreductase [Herbidospora mongoliensis]
MGDLGHELWFGVGPEPRADSPAWLVDFAVLAEEAGLDLVALQDHPYQPRHLDTLTALGQIGARTERIRLLPNVANLPLRPPQMLAKAVASLDLLTKGRVEFGLGAGFFWDGVAAYGGSRRSPREAVDALSEAIDVIRLLWTPGEPVSYDGDHYRLDAAPTGPFPAHPVGIWVGAYKPRLLEVTGAKADGWIPSKGYVSREELPKLSRIVDEAAGGRAVTKAFNISGSFDPRGTGWFEGPPELWAEQLAELVLDLGMSVFVLGTSDERQLKIFAAEVAPKVRELVAAERPAAASTITTLIDDASRPRLPKRDPAQLSRRQREIGNRLVLIHNHLRQELARIGEAVGQVAEGRAEAAMVRSMINDLTMRQNYWTLGSFCASYCRVLTAHHSIEDAHMFPGLVAAQASLAPVIQRLEEEHEVIADILTGLDSALVAMVEDPSGLDVVRRQVTTLTEALLSHLAYEEEELVEPLSRLELDV